MKKFSFVDNLNFEEKILLKNKLSGQILEFFDSENNLVSHKKKHFDILASLLRQLTLNFNTIPYNGVSFRGYPEWLDNKLLSELIVEADIRKDKPLDRTDHYLGCGGNIADELSVNKNVINFVENFVGKVKPTGVSSYIYYDREGTGIKPHIDTAVFSINMIIMLKHEYDSEKSKSSTNIFPAYSSPEKYYLNIGEVMIMHGSSIVHTRSIIKKNEKVHLLTIGFNRL